VLSKNAGERYGRTKYGAACQKCWMTKYGGHQMLAKNAGYRYGAHQTDCTPSLFFVFLFFLIRHRASFFLITTLSKQTRLGGRT
jgi:hypothetical protein